MVEKFPGDHSPEQTKDELNRLKAAAENKDNADDTDEIKDRLETSTLVEQQNDIADLHKESELESIHNSASALKAEIQSKKQNIGSYNPEELTEEQIEVASNLGRQASVNKVESIITATKRIPEWFHNS